MASSSDLSVGAFIKFNGELCVILEYQHRTPGNLRAFYQSKMRNVKSGKLAEHRFRADESVDIVRVEARELQYLYKDGESLVCMDNETYEQTYLDQSVFSSGVEFLKEGMNVSVSFDGDTPVFGEVPNFVVLEVTYTEPGIRGDTATKTLKPATVETGAVVKIPLFCDIGEMIRIDTRTSEYVDRVKK